MGNRKHKRVSIVMGQIIIYTQKQSDTDYIHIIYMERYYVWVAIWRFAGKSATYM